MSERIQDKNHLWVSHAKFVTMSNLFAQAAVLDLISAPNTVHAKLKTVQTFRLILAFGKGSGFQEIPGVFYKSYATKLNEATG